MSGVYGFSTIIEESAELSNARIRILEKRNTIYGSQGSENNFFSGSALGCHLEHFSDRFAADKPILQYDVNTVAVIDALIFNRDELLQYLTSHRDKLSEEAALFSDERLLLHIFFQYGNEGLRKVNGDFAGAIWDTRIRQWTLFRDHLGVRPLFFYLDDHIFAFSTDIRGLTAMPSADTSVNEEELYLQLTMKNTLDKRRTDFSRIQCVPAGHVLTVSQREGFSLSEQCYWRPKERKIRLRGGEATYASELQLLITDAVSRRMKAVSGKIGAELSGGLDSSVISVIAHRIDPQTIFASWSDDPDEYPMQESDVRKNIEAICLREEMDCKYLSFDGVSQTYYQRTLSVEPPPPPYINTLAIGEATRFFKTQNARVVLSGQGGDEGCSHRGSVLELYHQHEYIQFVSEIFHSTKARPFRCLHTIVNVLRAAFVQYPAAKKSWGDNTGRDIDIINKTFEYSKAKKVPSPILWFLLAPERYIDQGAERLRTETTAVLAAENGGRYLFPFLDYRLVDFSVSIPRHLHLRNGLNRYLFREAFRNLLPEEMYRYTCKTDMGARPASLETRRENILNCFRSYIEILRESDWEPYLDFDEIKTTIKKVTLDKSCITENNIYEYGYMADQLYRCVMIQRLQEESCI